MAISERSEAAGRPIPFAFWKQQLKSAHNWCHIADMRIRPDDLVVGFPAKQIRKLLRQSAQFLSVDDVTKVLGLRGKSALRLLETLEQQGFIEKNTFAPDPNKNWKHTIKGGALSNALFSAPVSRRECREKHLANLWIVSGK